MKKIFTLIAAISLVSLLNAQITNATFESWVGGSGYVDPVDWDTPNSIIFGFGGTDFVVDSSANASEGTYACLMETKTLTSYSIPGLITNGNITVSLAPAGATIKGGQAWSSTPTHLEGDYRFIPAGMDTCLIRAYFTRWNGSGRDTVGSVEFRSTLVELSYSPFSEPITWTGSDPDTMQIIAASSAGYESFAAVTGTQFWLDDLSFTGSTGRYDILANKYDIQIFPNPANEIITIESEVFGKNVMVEVYSILGNKVMEMNMTETRTTLNLDGLNEGMYLYKIKEGDKVIFTSKFKKVG